MCSSDLFPSHDNEGNSFITSLGSRSCSSIIIRRASKVLHFLSLTSVDILLSIEPLVNLYIVVIGFE